MIPVTKILAATDFSQAATHAVDYAAQLAGALGAPLHIVHVHMPPQVIVPEGGTFTAIYDDALIKKELPGLLAAAAARAREQGARTVETELVDGVAWEQIIRTAEARGCDLIILSTHGRGGVPRFLLGSVADKVVRKSACPVLTIGPRA